MTVPHSDFRAIVNYGMLAAHIAAYPNWQIASFSIPSGNIYLKGQKINYTYLSTTIYILGSESTSIFKIDEEC